MAATHPHHRPLTIAISGSSGLVGTALCQYFLKKNYQVKRLVRQHPRRDSSKEIYWNPDSGHIESQSLENCDVVIHLAGENIAHKRWSSSQKNLIRQSRIKSTHFLSQTLAKLKRPPRLFISASAIGFYGSRDDENLTEDSAPGIGFLSEICREWEHATHVAERAGIRVVHLRTGMVLSKEAGVLRTLLQTFSRGLGCVLGSGNQYVSWISITDVAHAIEHLFSQNSLEGPVNLVAPEPVTQRHLCETLSHTIGKPIRFSIPAWLLKLFLGQAGSELLLSSCKAYPARLLKTGFHFTHPTVEKALPELLK